MNDFKNELVAVYKAYKVRVIAFVVADILFSLYLRGLLAQFRYAGTVSGYVVAVDPINCIWYGLWSPIPSLCIFLIILLTGYRIYRVYLMGSILPKFGYELSVNDTFGSGGVMSKEEMRERFYDVPVMETTGLILGRSGTGDNVLVYNNSTHALKVNGHILAIAASGRGKSRGLVIPNLFQALRAGMSVVVLDPKGELFEQTSEFAKNEFGVVVKMVNTKQPGHSDGWNVMDLFYLTDENGNPLLGDRVSLAQQITDIIVCNTVKKEGKVDVYFTDMSVKLFTAMLCYDLWKCDQELGKKRASLANIYTYLTMYSPAMIVKEFARMPKDAPGKTVANDFSNSPDAVKDSARTGATNMIKELASPDVVNMLSHSEIDFTLPGKKQCIYYVVTDSTSQETLWMAGLFINSVFKTLLKGVADHTPGQKLPVETLFLMDEFRNSVVIPGFLTYLATVRSAGIALFPILQDVDQAKTMFEGDEWKTFMNGFDIQICGGTNAVGMDGDTAEYFSAASGTVTIETETDAYMKSRFNPLQVIFQSRRTSAENQRPGLNPEDVAGIDKTAELIKIPFTNKLVYAEKFDCEMHPYYKKALEYPRTLPAFYIPEYKRRATSFSFDDDDEGDDKGDSSPDPDNSSSPDEPRDTYSSNNPGRSQPIPAGKGRSRQPLTEPGVAFDRRPPVGKRKRTRGKKSRKI